MGVRRCAPYALVDHAISRLRKKIEQDAHAPQFIHTVRGDGYCLTPGAAGHPRTTNASIAATTCDIGGVERYLYCPGAGSARMASGSHRMHYRRLLANLYVQVLIAIAAGVVFGIVAPEHAAMMKPLATVSSSSSRC